MKTLAFALATMMTCCVATTAHATAPVQNVEQRAVSYDDVDLQSEDGAGMLLVRIQTAARRVCGLANPGLLSPYMRDQLQSCANQSAARAIADVDSPLLTHRAMRLGVIDSPAATTTRM